MKEKNAKAMAEQVSDENLKKFYENAAKGFSIKRDLLTIEKASELVK